MGILSTMNPVPEDNAKLRSPPLQVLPIANTHDNHAPGLHDDEVSGIPHDELQRLSSRPYATRVSDPTDFAFHWESNISLCLERLLEKHCMSDFSVDVHCFPDRSPEAVPHVIYITTDAANSTMEDEISDELGRDIPPRFAPVYLQFRQGKIEKSAGGYVADNERDKVCEAKNLTFRDIPCIGISIGPVRHREAATLGGFIKLGPQLYALTAFHTFKSCTKSGDLRVMHPASPDLQVNRFQDPVANSYGIGRVAMYARAGSLRPSLTFRGTNLPKGRTLVEMDWCLVGPVENGKNIVAMPTFNMNRDIAVETDTDVMGNTEVYAMARTSGYSLGFTSNVPGFQRINGMLHREWAVRQYSPSSPSADPGLHWQTTKEWITSGIGVPGDSGAWLLRRSDNAVMGLVWARNRNRGNPNDCVRLTYFTPIVDVLAHVAYMSGETVSIPSFSAEEGFQGAETEARRAMAQRDIPEDPWSPYNNVASIAAFRREQSAAGNDVGPNDFRADHPRFPATRESPTTQVHWNAGSSAVAGDGSSSRTMSEASVSKPRGKLIVGASLSEMPKLSRSSSVNSLCSSEEAAEEVNPTASSIRIVDEGVDDELEGVEEITELVRSKAVFEDVYFGPLGASAPAQTMGIC